MNLPPLLLIAPGAGETWIRLQDKLPPLVEPLRKRKLKQVIQ